MLALLGSVLVVGSVGVGATLLWRRRRWWWERWLADRAWGWALPAAVAAMGVWVAITTHPRPSYLFPLNFTAMAVIGMSAMVIAGRWPTLSRARGALPVVAIMLVALVPQHYKSGYSNPLYGPGRGASEMVSRLQPYGDRIAGSDTILLGRYSYEACNYVVPENPCVGAPVGLFGPKGTSPDEWLKDQETDFIYAERSLLEDPAARQVLHGLQGRGWLRIAPRDLDADWLLLGRAPAGEQQSA
jgi:hypothetical protein